MKEIIIINTFFFLQNSNESNSIEKIEQNLVTENYVTGVNKGFADIHIILRYFSHGSDIGL